MGTVGRNPVRMRRCHPDRVISEYLREDLGNATRRPRSARRLQAGSSPTSWTSPNADQQNGSGPRESYISSNMLHTPSQPGICTRWIVSDPTACSEYLAAPHPIASCHVTQRKA